MRSRLARPAEADVRRIEVLVVRVTEGGHRYSFGLLVRQVRELITTELARVRPLEGHPPDGPPAEVLHDGQWLPVYDLAARLHLLAPWKQGVTTTLRPYLLVMRDAQDRPAALAVDQVAGIGACALNRVLPLPAWLRRQAHPPAVWAGLAPDDLIQSQEAVPDAAGVEEDTPTEPTRMLLLLLDCASLLGT
jgi:chemotaxis signal transduction protein